MNVDFSFPSLLYEGLIKAYVSGSQYISVSWVLGYIFIGSFLSYAILVLFGKNEKRTPFYIGLFIFLFVFDQSYICFLTGIVAAGLLRRSQDGKMRPFSPSAGLLLAAYPMVCLPKRLDVITLYGIGAAMFVAGIAGCRIVQRFLETKLLQISGRYSFSVILIHMPVLSAVSCLQYLLMAKAGLSNTVTVPAVFLAAIPVQILAAFLFQKLTVPLTNLLVEKVRNM